MTTITLVTKAYRCAASWHFGQVRRGTSKDPLTKYLAEAADLVSVATQGRDINLIVATVLHDAIEHGGVIREQIATEFNQDIADLVAEVSGDMEPSDERYRQQQIETLAELTPRARLLWIAAQTANLRSLHAGQPLDGHDYKNDCLRLAREVVNGARGHNEILERAFDEAADALEKVLWPQGVWTVFGVDHWQWPREDATYVRGFYQTHEEAVAACRTFIDRQLKNSTAGSAQTMFEQFRMGGEGAFIEAPRGEPLPEPRFSADDYTRQRCNELRPGPKARKPGDTAN